MIKKPPHSCSYRNCINKADRAHLFNNESGDPFSYYLVCKIHGEFISDADITLTIEEFKIWEIQDN